MAEASQPTNLNYLSQLGFRFAVEKIPNVNYFCQAAAIDAHHIIDRKLWADGGYFIDNGAALGEEREWKKNYRYF